MVLLGHTHEHKTDEHAGKRASRQAGKQAQPLMHDTSEQGFAETVRHMIGKQHADTNHAINKNRHTRQASKALPTQIQTQDIMEPRRQHAVFLHPHVWFDSPIPAFRIRIVTSCK